MAATKELWPPGIPADHVERLSRVPPVYRDNSNGGVANRQVQVQTRPQRTSDVGHRLYSLIYGLWTVEIGAYREVYRLSESM